MSFGHQIPKSASRCSSKFRVILLAAVLSIEAACLVFLNLSPVTYKRVVQGVMIADDFRGWPAIFWTHRQKQGGAIRNAIHSHTVRNEALGLNVGVSICLLALSVMLAVFTVRRRLSLRTLLAATLLIAVLCALFVEASKQEYQPPIPSVWLRPFIHR